MSNRTFEILGWYGASAIMAAYFLNSFNWLDANTAGYQLLNLTGAIGMGAIGWHKKVNPSVAINLIWAVIALVAVARIVIR